LISHNLLISLNLKTEFNRKLGRRMKLKQQEIKTHKNQLQIWKVMKKKKL
jgi:hypothetical protein